MNGEQRISRRTLLTAAGARLFLLTGELVDRGVKRAVVRPPGALSEPEFLLTCTRCGECARRCVRGVILLAGPDQGVALGTPYVDFSRSNCDFCYECVKVCPSDALKKTREPVPIGKARILRERCLAFQGQVCGNCAASCPAGINALHIVRQRYPEINADRCIGCGNCVQRCLAMPKAIEIFPI
ncbi:MAG: 4Fe-4S dicluster domain-containing protein [Thermoanaerobacteraceae bacterium]|nr:4Fe-4S dicluster domain-containing protein [Thermoanaerobacteraceae bacterium]